MGDAPDAASFAELFRSIPDPRVDRTKLHSLESILLLSLCAIICGANGMVSIAEFGRSRRDFLEELVEFPNGIPSHDTIGRVLAKLRPSALREMFVRWTECVAQMTRGEVVAIDGKTLRRACNKSAKREFVHMVSAWATDNRIVLGQVKTDDKSNEITAIPRLLELLRVQGCLVTIDAMGCQTEIAKKIRESDADYMLNVKDNQPKLKEAIDHEFFKAFHDGEAGREMSYHETEARAHGRHETRRCRTLPVPKDMPGREAWTDLATIVQIETERTVNGKTSEAVRYFISSVESLKATDALAAVRSHWGIENELHWVLDVAFREDDSRARTENAAENYAVLRHLALNLLRGVKAAKRKKLGIANLRLKAAWSDAFLLDTLCAAQN